VCQQADGKPGTADTAAVTTEYLFTWKEFALAAACVLALGVLSETALAQARDINEHALLLDWRGAPPGSVHS
jgi:hypothetical protein